jgi:uncharacterized protein YkwD
MVMAGASASGAKPKSADKLPPDQLREAQRLLSEYRTAGSDMAKKTKVFNKVIAIDAAAVPLMIAAIEKDLRPQLRRYSGRFQQQAGLVAKKRSVKIDVNEVVQLRKTVLGIQNRGDGFTKEAIVKEGDPALKKLLGMAVIDRAAILEQSPELQADRKKLEGLGSLWEQAQKQLPKSPVEGKQEPPKTPSFEEYLQGEESLAAAMATPMDVKTRAILSGNARLAEKLDPEEARTVLACNLTRNLLGLSALAIDLKLCDTARDHSKDMETLKFFAHDSPVDGKKTPWDRAKRFGTTANGENIFMGVSDGKAANEGWFHSPGHHKNMLGDHTRIGVGRSGTYFTEMFGK